MAEAANNIFKSMDGWWVSGGDQQKVLDQLRGKSAEEVAEIRRSYADHCPGHDLDADIGKNLGKDQPKEAKPRAISALRTVGSISALDRVRTFQATPAPSQRLSCSIGTLKHLWRAICR